MWTTNLISQSINFILENFYYLSGIALFLVGLKQIQNVTNQSKERNKREAITLTSKQCEKFYKELIPLIGKLDDLLTKNNIDLDEYHNKLSNDKKNKIIVNKESMQVIREMLENDSEFMKDYIYTTNLFEAFATYFVSGVADSKIAFQIIGRVYCSSVVTLFPILIIANNLAEHDKRYTATIKLYTNWSTEIIKENAEKEYMKSKKNNNKQFETIGT